MAAVNVRVMFMAFALPAGPARLPAPGLLPFRRALRLLRSARARVGAGPALSG